MEELVSHLQATPKVTTPKRRRVPIEIVEADTRPSHETQVATPPETKNMDLLQPVSSRTLKQENKSTTTQDPPSIPQTFVDAKQAREESKSIRVSGGIFRHTGNHTIVTRTPSETTSPTRESTSRPTPSNASTPRPPKPPTTLFQFTKSWDSLQSDTDKWNLIRVSYMLQKYFRKFHVISFRQSPHLPSQYYSKFRWNRSCLNPFYTHSRPCSSMIHLQTQEILFEITSWPSPRFKDSER